MQKYDALNFKSIQKKIIRSHYNWHLIKNDYPYINIADNKIKEHLLIVNSNDLSEDIWDFRPGEQLRLIEFLKILSEEFTNSMVLYKNKGGKSIRKFHLHFFIF